jgi:acetyl esterase/lipase
MPSKAFCDFQNQIPAEPPFAALPVEKIPQEFLDLHIPMLPPDFVPPEPVVPEGFTAEKVTVGGVPGLHVTGKHSRPGAVHMHIHGGGFTVGSAMDAGPLLAQFTEATGLEGYSVDYRLAPWHPFPAGINDCVEFYKGLLELGYEKIVVGGESAGGCATLALVHALKQQGLPLPVCIWCSSPAVDQCYDQKPTYIRDMFLDTAEGIRKGYVRDADVEDPLVSPIYGDFHDFPPMFLQAGGGESLAAGVVRLAVKAIEAGNEVHLHFGKEMPHTFAMDYEHYPEARFALDEFTEFVVRSLELDCASAQ